MSLRDVSREFKEVPLGLIDEPALASRATMNEAALDELTRSIARDGVISPLALARTGDRFEVIAGHRRLLASKRAGLVAVPAVIYPSTSAYLEAVKFGENKYREDLNPAEEAIWFQELLERDAGGDTDTLAAQLGVTRAYVEGRLLLFAGDPEVFDALQHGKIGIGVAHELNKCTDERQRRSFLYSAVMGGATKAVVSGWILDWQRSERIASGEPAPASSSPAPAPVPESNYFTCYACSGGDNVHTMQPVNVHSHCRLAILDKALEQYQRRGDVLLMPRTVEEAHRLIAQLLERFPELVPSS